MIRLIRHTHLEPPNDFPVRRLLAAGIFESASGVLSNKTVFSKGVVDIGSPYVIVPYSIHRHGLHLYQDLGRQPYRLTGNQRIFQPFAEVGVRFVVNRPPLIYHPDQFLRVKAYLLEPTVSPGSVVIGLDTIEQHFTLYVPPPPKDAFLLEPGDAIP